MDIKKKITSLKAALEYNGETEEQFAERTKNDSPDEVGYKELKAVVLALNEGENVKRGYYPWFNSSGSGAGFSFLACAYGHSCSRVGARLLLKTPDLAIYAGKKFIKSYDKHING